jgi:hypothetical protein
MLSVSRRINAFLRRTSPQPSSVPIVWVAESKMYEQTNEMIDLDSTPE